MLIAVDRQIAPTELENTYANVPKAGQAAVSIKHVNEAIVNAQGIKDTGRLNARWLTGYSDWATTTGLRTVKVVLPTTETHTNQITPGQHMPSNLGMQTKLTARKMLCLFAHDIMRTISIAKASPPAKSV